MSVAATSIAVLTALHNDDVDSALAVIDADDTPTPRALTIWLARALLTQLRSDALTDSQIRELLESRGLRYAFNTLDEERHDA
jgi:hypothetical protein